MGFARIRTDSWNRDLLSYVDADRVTRIASRGNGYGSYMLEGEDRWTETYESLDTLAQKIEEARSK